MNDFCLALLCLLASAPSQADEVFVGYGVGVFHDADQWVGQMKIAEAGYRHFFFDGVYGQAKVGYWGEGSNDKSRQASGYVAVGAGMEVNLQPVEFRGSYGVAGITTPDSQLGSRFPQFNGEIYFGVRDKHGVGMGVDYQHFSCASFCSPNEGRDAGILQFSKRW